MHRLLRVFKTMYNNKQDLNTKRAALIKILYKENKARQTKFEIVEYVNRLTVIELNNLFEKYNIK